MSSDTIDSPSPLCPACGSTDTHEVWEHKCDVVDGQATWKPVWVVVCHECKHNEREAKYGNFRYTPYSQQQ